MSTPLQIVLTATPLSLYFYVLGFFHGGKRPRAISGPVDVALMAFGLGGLVAFGPFGRAVLGRLAGDPAGAVAWGIWVGVVMLWGVVLASSASLRVSVYHVVPDDLDRAVRDALDGVEGRFARTIGGFEDAERGVGVRVKATRWLRSGSVEAYGRSPDALIRELAPRLTDALARYPQRPSILSPSLFVAACLTVVVPMTGFFFANPKAQEAVRNLLQSLRWW